MSIIVFLLEFILLFFLSRALTREISRILPVRVLSFLFLPGIIIHELSHILVASIMFVPVGEIEFLPKVTGNTVRLGSAAIGKTDPIRRAIIGLAPILAGLFILFGATTLGVPILLLLYIVFEVGNTMFSSLKDLEGLVEVLLAAIILFLIFYFFTTISGIGTPSITLPIKQIKGLLQPVVLPLTIAVGINIAAIVFFRVIRIVRG